MIAFGTSGWRGHLAYDFTFEGVSCVVKAIAEVVKKDPRGANGVIIGRDPRFLGDKFARDTARILAAEGVTAYLVERDVPTPVLAHAVIHNELAGAINFTASHNPSDYGGIKFSMSTGGPALPHVTREIADLANQLLNSGWKPRFSEDYRTMDPLEAYFDSIERIIDFSLLRNHKYAVNPLYGTAGGFWMPCWSAMGWTTTLLTTIGMLLLVAIRLSRHRSIFRISSILSSRNTPLA